MILAESLPTPSVPPATYGVIVIVLLQLAQFFFAFMRHQRSSEAVKKEDLNNLRAEFGRQIKGTDQDVKALATSVKKELHEMKADADRSRRELHEKINTVTATSAALLKGQDIAEQSLAALSTKLDAVRDKLSTRS